MISIILKKQYFPFISSQIPATHWLGIMNFHQLQQSEKKKKNKQTPNLSPCKSDPRITDQQSAWRKMHWKTSVHGIPSALPLF